MEEKLQLAVQWLVQWLVQWVYELISHFEMHDDELMARCLLRAFGEKLFPGIRRAKLRLVNSGLRRFDGQTGEQLFIKGRLCLGTVGGPFDEHDLPPEERQNASAATLAAKALGVDQYEPIKVMLRHTVRVDRTPTATSFDVSSLVKALHRNGTPIEQVCRWYDRIFDAWLSVLSGKIRNPQWDDRPSFDDLVRAWLITNFAPPEYVDNPKWSTSEAVVEMYLEDSRPLHPLIRYIVREERNDSDGTKTDNQPFELRGMVDALNMDGASVQEVQEFTFDALHAKYDEQVRFLKAYDELVARQRAGTLYIKKSRWRIIQATSDNSEMNRAVRKLDPYYDVFIQRNTDGHVVVWYNKTKLNMDQVIAHLRAADMHATGKRYRSWDELKREGTLPWAPWWYYDPATGQFSCGTRTNRRKPITQQDNNQLVSTIENHAKIIEKAA